DRAVKPLRQFERQPGFAARGRAGDDHDRWKALGTHQKREPALISWHNKDVIKDVIPAKAGTHLSATRLADRWVPAFAGMTIFSYSRHGPGEHSYDPGRHFDCRIRQAVAVRYSGSRGWRAGAG